MTSEADRAAAQWALRGTDAEIMYGDPSVLTPPAAPELAAAGWTIRAHLTGIDAVLRLRWLMIGAQRHYYGFLAERAAGEYLLAVRGTSGVVEWWEDLEGEPVPHPLAGKVHDGFNDIYLGMQVLPLGDALARPLIVGLCEMLPGGASVTVVGHSLGSPLAGFTQLDLARAAPSLKLAGRFFASPRPGDADFAAYFDSHTPDYQAYFNPRDIVPQVPKLLGYTPLPRQQELVPALVADNPVCNHHCLMYASMLDPLVLEGAAGRPQYLPYLGCVIGAAA